MNVREGEAAGDRDVQDAFTLFGVMGQAIHAAYTATKGGMNTLTKSMALDYAKDGIRVNALCPGFIETPLTSALRENEAVHTTLKSLHPLGRLGMPEEVARCALFLGSDEASFVTGHPMVIDGGTMAGS